MSRFVSVAYTSKDVLYRWNEEHSVHVDPNMKMSQFDLISNPVSNYTLSVSSGACLERNPTETSPKSRINSESSQ